MDRRERFKDHEELLRLSQDAFRLQFWCAGPGIIKGFDPQEQTVTVQLAIKGKVADPTGRQVAVSMPPLIHCPVVFPGGGGYTLTFPVAVGDECLVVFGDRCIDAWWQNGGEQLPLEYRSHDLSDGFAIVGPRSLPRMLDPRTDTAAVQLRSDDGQAFVEIRGRDVNVTTPATVRVTAGGDVVAQVGGTATVHAAGAATVRSDASIALAAPQITFDGNVVINGVNWNHKHTGVRTGTDASGGQENL